ncbi:hypothetical protein [Roseivirga thermotolerans]|uniref:Uncharacterized protein n=1 Tax=Roseivirga thermotolerans TaxID=1758176 RepID=A0ABQ3I602_9BACT|nr:hypothetical protein [Roseivirga thermotolerans]GHE65117.1 hypothetical protein GCM10011340_20210 [Roseivirga thermotolerans]
MEDNNQKKLSEGLQPITQSVLNEHVGGHLKAFVSVSTNNNLIVSAGLAEYSGLKSGDNVFIQTGDGMLVISTKRETSDQVPFRLTNVNGDTSAIQFKSLLLKRHLDKLNNIETKKTYRFNLNNYSSPVEWPLILKLEDSTHKD